MLLTRQVALADLATALQVGVPEVRAGAQELTGRLAAVGLAVADDGVTVELTVLAYAAEPVGRVEQLEALRALTPEAVMTMVIIGHLGEAPRRDVDERRGTDSTGARPAGPHGLVDRRTERTGAGLPHA